MNPTAATDPCPRCHRKMLVDSPGLTGFRCCWCGWAMTWEQMVLADARRDRARKRELRESDMDERIREVRG